MKIVLDGTALYGQFGGIEIALWQTIAGLDALEIKHDINVLIPRDAPDLESQVQNSHIKFERLPFTGTQKLRRILWQQLQLPFYLKQQKSDLLHAPTYVAPLLSPVPVVLGVPDLIALNRPYFATIPNRVHYRAIMPRALKKAAKVIVTTQKTKEEVLRRVPTADCRVVSLGVEPEFLKKVSQEQKTRLFIKYGLPPEFLLYVGNFEPKKNLPRLLKAVDMLGDSAPPLVLVGGIKPWPAIEPLLAHTRQLGFVPREEVPVLLSMCRVFCFPSLCEGFGMPVLEALACGANVVASEQVPLPVLDKVARTPDPRSSLAIAEAIQEALFKPYASDAARKYAREFTWERTARETLAIYEEALT